MWKYVIISISIIAIFWGLCVYGGQEKGSWGPWPENFYNGCIKAWNYISEWASHTSNESVRGRAEDIFILTNEKRAEEGLPPFIRDLALDRLAQGHAEYMYNEGGECNHGGFEWRANQAFKLGYNNVSENVARGGPGAREFVNQWMDSFFHRCNIMSEYKTNIGVGVYGNYAVQLFAGY